MENFTKAAYDAGVQQALVDFGLSKEANRGMKLVPDVDAGGRIFGRAGGVAEGTQYKTKPTPKTKKKPTLVQDTEQKVKAKRSRLNIAATKGNTVVDRTGKQVRTGG
jgi:hypothetical protein